MRSEKGFSLLEVILAMAIIGIVGVALLLALGGASRSISISDEQATAQSLTRTELEYIKSQDFADLPTSTPWSYELPLDNHPSWDEDHSLPAGYEEAGYSIIVVGDAIDIDGDSTPDNDALKMTISVYHHDKPQPIVTVEDYKVDR
jgi:prepilin-type N-terminal cleavage/methylation domain-containing protein